jgi:hypothetical protein
MRDIMKKILLASTALVAVAVVGSAASASERITASVSGYMYGGVGYSDTGFGPTQVDDIGILRDGEIHFNFRGSSDNGLTFDGRVELEAWSQGNDQIDENWLRVSGSWGFIRIGGDDHASYNMATGVIFFAGAHIGHYDAFGESGGPLGFSTNNRFGDQIGIAYNTPVFSGFQAQISYHPSLQSDGFGFNNVPAGGGRIQIVQNDSNSLKFGDADIISVGVNYQGTFSDVNVRASGGYDYVSDGSNGVAGLNDDSEDAWTAGLQFGYMGFVIGGLYKQALDLPGRGKDSEDYVLNVGYTTGPWNFGLGYTNSDSGNYEMDKFAGWINYALAPGVSVGAGMEYQDTSSDGRVTAYGSEGFSGMAILSLSF